MTVVNVDLTTPEAQIAQDFMVRKGYQNVVPVDYEAIDSAHPCYYFYYDLPEGELELEVSFDPKSGMWDTLVTAFDLHY